MRFDYVIIGAGSAGCVLAARLSEDPGTRVLLLEAGGSDDAMRVRTPGLVGLLWRNRFDWEFYTTPQEHLDGRKMHWPRGKVLGGTSSINYMVYMRGHRDNYDAWRALGNEGWGYDDVLPYFRRSEDNARGADAFHGVGGPLHVSDVDCNAMSDRLVEAAKDALGVRGNTDFNGVEQEGVGRVQGGRAKTVRAEREVVLSGGAIGSPHVLLLSGIGPADALRARGVRVVHDLPGVGKNLQDHLLGGIGYQDKAGLTGNVRPTNLLRWLARYALTQRGPLASGGAESGGFVRSRPDAPRPDLQFHFLPVGSDQVSFDEESFQPKGHAFTVLPVLLYPKSRGEIRLASADPAKPPAIDPRYLSDEADATLLLEGHRLAQRITRSKVLDDCRGGPQAAVLESDDDATIRAEGRRRCNTIFHPVGTCKMGSDDAAVVDARLRVRGIDGLRVVDASIMPTIVGGNTNAPTIMIGEKGADLIRGRSCA